MQMSKYHMMTIKNNVTHIVCRMFSIIFNVREERGGKIEGFFIKFSDEEMEKFMF